MICALLAVSLAAGSVRGTPLADSYVNSLHPDADNGAAVMLRVNGQLH